jgi:hypothetical protein
MTELVNASVVADTGSAKLRAVHTFAGGFESTKQSIAAVLSAYPPAPIAWGGFCLDPGK